MNLGPRWYVVHTYSGYENKVKTNLEKIIENRHLEHLIYEVFIPTEIVVEQKGDEEKVTESKLFPAYVLVKMTMTDESWHVVRNITGVTGFVGPGSRPVPLTEEEVLECIEDDIYVDFKDDGTVWVYSKDFKEDITDKFDEKGYCKCQLNDGEQLIDIEIEPNKNTSISTTPLN